MSERKAGTSLYDVLFGWAGRRYGPTAAAENSAGAQPQAAGKGGASSATPSSSLISPSDTATTSLISADKGGGDPGKSFWDKYPIPEQSGVNQKNKSRENFLNARGSIKYSLANFNPTAGIEYQQASERAYKDRPAGGWNPADMFLAAKSRANAFDAKSELSHNTLFGDMRNYRAPRFSGFGGPKPVAYADKGQIYQNLEDDKKRFVYSLDQKEAAEELAQFKIDEVKRREEEKKKLEPQEGE